MNGPEPETMPRARCERCHALRFTVRTAKYETTGDDGRVHVEQMCGLCRRTVGAELVAPEATPPSIVDLAVERVELVEARQPPIVTDPPYAESLPYTWPDPEVVS